MLKPVVRSLPTQFDDSRWYTIEMNQPQRAANKIDVTCSLRFGFMITASCFLSGCATWLPTGEEPPAPKKAGFVAVAPTNTAGIETIMLRLDATQAQGLSSLWAETDEQSIAPELRLRLDKQGMRAGKISGDLPAVLDGWLKAAAQRLEEDPLEQTGLAADISSYTQLFRCRKNSRKELKVRNFPNDQLLLPLDASETQYVVKSPQFLYAIEAEPINDGCARLQLTPEVQYGDAVRKAVPRESGIHMDTLRESYSWNQLTIKTTLRRGDCFIVGATEPARNLAQHFLHTQTKSGEIQPVLLLIRLSELNQNDMFSGQ